ncbi:MAG TPA: hypothetical protein VH110_07020 [Candidatus Acidoferrum sp.]|nr:hypothetical protein [Candidatus Acidoferrum sp.]
MLRVVLAHATTLEMQNAEVIERRRSAACPSDKRSDGKIHDRGGISLVGPRPWERGNGARGRG